MFQLELARFQQAALEMVPDRSVLVRGCHRQPPGRELYALVGSKRLRLDLMPHLECRVVELYPLLFFDRQCGEVDDRIPAQLGFSRVNRFFLVVDRSRGKSRFGSVSGGLVLDRAWRGFGLGGYLMAQLVSWGKAHYPASAVSTEHLDLRRIEVERAVLNGFCRWAGFDIVFHGDEEATCWVKRMERLCGEYNRERVAELAELPPGDWFSPGFQGERAAQMVRREYLAPGR